MMNDPAALRRYLLGTASDEERDLHEDAYFQSADALSAMEDAEDALIEAYLDDGLPVSDRAAFEQHYLASPIHRRRLQVAKGLRRAAVDRHAPVAWSGLGLAAAALLAVTVAGLIWLTRTQTARDEVTQAVAEGPLPAPAPLPPTIPLPPPAPIVVALTVPSVAVRGSGGPPTALLPADAGQLSLRLLRDPGEPPIGEPLVVVETIDGVEVWQGPGTIGEGVEVSIPADELAGNDYFAHVFDTAGGRRADRGHYFFRVQRAPRAP